MKRTILILAAAMLCGCGPGYNDHADLKIAVQALGTNMVAHEERTAELGYVIGFNEGINFGIKLHSRGFTNEQEAQVEYQKLRSNYLATRPGKFMP